jgi:hypothetical protein
MLGQELPRQHQHVLAALAQRRQVELHHAQPEVQVGAEAPFAHQLVERRCVAATMRTLTRCSRTLPRRRTVRSSSSFSSLDCSAGSMSPISSRNRVPPSAVSTRPSLRSRASVKAPRSWPNSSDSSSCAGSAAQFSSTKGLARRGPLKCSARATSSLPVPVSPTHQHRRRVAVLQARLGLQQLAHGGPQALHAVGFTHERGELGAVAFALLEVVECAVLACIGRGALDQHAQLGQRDRLGQEVQRAGLHRIHRQLDAGVPRDHDHLGIRTLRADPRQRLQPVHARQVEVQHHDVGREGRQCGDPLLRRRRAAHLAALPLEVGAHVLGQHGLVLDDQDGVVHAVDSDVE